MTWVKSIYMQLQSLSVVCLALTFLKIDYLPHRPHDHLLQYTGAQDTTLYVKNITAIGNMTPSHHLATCQDPLLQEFHDQKKYLCCRSDARLGNLMFVFAAVYGMATKLNRTVVLSKNHRLLNLFTLDTVVARDWCVCEKYAKSVLETKACAFDEKFFQLTGPENFFPRRVLQSWKYFHHVRDSIRRQFRFKEHIRMTALGVLKNITAKCSGRPVVTVGIHVRRGDMVEKQVVVDRGYQVATADFFTKAMNFFRQRHKNVVFVVCSNGMKWTKANVNGSDVTYVEGNSPEVDMAVLSNCQHSIMSVGSFGWWSAFLTGGHVAYYRHPARKGSYLRTQFSDDLSDYFYPGWTAMD